MGDGQRSESEQSKRLFLGEMVRFFVVGIAATLTHYIVAMLCVSWTSLWLANFLGYLFAVFVSYFGHQRVTFQLPTEDVSHQRQAPRFVLSSLSGLAMSYLVLAVMNLVLAAPNWLSLAVVVTLVPIYTYFINKYWVFRQSGPLTPG